MSPARKVDGSTARPPVRVGPSMIDMGTALWGVTGILAALVRKKDTGRGGAVSDGMRAARAPVVGYIDVDLEVHCRYIPALVREIEKGAVPKPQKSPHRRSSSSRPQGGIPGWRESRQRLPQPLLNIP